MPQRGIRPKNQIISLIEKILDSYENLPALGRAHISLRVAALRHSYLAVGRSHVECRLAGGIGTCIGERSDGGNVGTGLVCRPLAYTPVAVEQVSEILD